MIRQKYIIIILFSILAHLQAQDNCCSYDNYARETRIPTYGQVTMINDVAVPSDFPRIDVLVNTAQTAPGKLFFGLRRSYFIILENDGTPYFYQKSRDYLMDFRVLENGLLSRTVDNWDTGEGFYAIMDSSYTYVDTFMVKGGEGTNHHDFLYLANGHTLYITNEVKNVDMSQLVPGGNPNARVIGNNIQEQDAAGNVIFHWKCWDHFNIEDAVYEDLTAGQIDYTHTNSIAVDFDGHILVSNRNLSECTKIHRTTGKIIWRMGGMHNMFTFLDTDENYYQHMLRPVSGKPNHYTMFDNGTNRLPKYTRAVEFKVDTSLMTVEKIWEYRKNPDYFAAWLGGVFRLPNGNTLINWGIEGLPFATEVNAGGEIVYEARNPDYIASYRSYRYPWTGVAKRPYLVIEALPEKVNLVFNKFGETNVAKYIIQQSFDGNTWQNHDTTIVPYTVYEDLQNHTDYYFRVHTLDGSGNASPFSNVEQITVNYIQTGTNFLQNGDFSAGKSGWNLGVYETAIAGSDIDANGRYKITIDNSGDQIWHVQLTQNDVPLINGREYLFQFEAYSDINRIFDGKVERNGPPYTNYGKINASELKQYVQHYAFRFKMQDPTDYKARIVFNCGQYAGNVYIDNVSLMEVTPNSVMQKPVKQLVKFALYQNYPNPFNASTRIRYHITHRSNVRLSIYDINGRLIDTLLHSNKDAGDYYFNYHAAHLASGIYYYAINVDQFRQVKKMVVIK
jgi:hypothetical protein